MAFGRSGRPEDLEKFLVELEDYVPTVRTLKDVKDVVPDEVTQHCLRLSGMDCKETPVIRLISLAAQNLIASVAADAYEIQQRRAKERTKPGNEPGRPKENDVVLTSEVLGEALEEYGLNLKLPPYIMDDRGKGRKAQHPP